MKRSHVGVFVAVVVVALLCLWWFSRDATKAPEAQPKPLAKGVVSKPVLALPKLPSGTALLPVVEEPITKTRLVPGALGAAEKPRIEAIEVEQNEVCDGAENLITVRASSPGGNDDPFFSYSVNNRPGSAVPLRLSWQESAGYPPLVTVFGRDGKRATAKLPAYTVRGACRETDYVVISASARSQTPSQITFTPAVSFKSNGNPNEQSAFEPSSIKWDFGDGTQEEVAYGPVTHDYGARKQRSMYSQMLVRAEVISSDGKSMRGRYSLQLKNEDFAERYLNKKVVLHAQQVMGAGRVAKIKLFHAHGLPVQITEIRAAQLSTSDMSTNDDARAPEGTVADLGASALGLTEIGTGEGSVGSLRFADGIVAQDVLIRGTTNDGFTAEGRLWVAAPDADELTQRMSVDLGFRKKVFRARKRLQRSEVTMQDMEQELTKNAGEYMGLDPVYDPFSVPAASSDDLAR